MLIKMTCPQCGAQMDIDDSKEFIYCQFCGTKIMNMAQKVEVTQNITVTHTVDRSNEPNLYISYVATNTAVRMITRIVDTGKKDVYLSGQSLTFHLTPGKHIVVLKIGKINYNREIYIPEDNTPVRINASWDGHAHISIDQPAYTEPVAVQKTVVTKTENNQTVTTVKDNTASAPKPTPQPKSNPQPKPASTPKVKEVIPDDAPMMRHLFNKGMIAPWIITGVLLLFFLIYLSISVGSSMMFLLAALAMNPVGLYYLKKKTKVPKVLAFVLAGVLFFIGLFIAGSTGSTSTDAITTTERETTNEQAIVDEAEEVTITEEETAAEDEITADSNALLQEEVSSKYELTYMGEVNNDVTGNWYYSIYTGTVPAEQFVEEYAEAFIKNTGDVHAVINKELGTTTRFFASDGLIDITVHKYVENEELDAKELFGGEVIGNYWFNLKTGELEGIEETVSEIEVEQETNGLIDTFVEQFNNSSVVPLEYIEDFIPSDKNSTHYRVEFRLSAYSDAKGKSYNYGGVTVDLVSSEALFDETLRIYMDGASLEQCVELLTTAAPKLNPDITETEISDTVNYITENKEANGYYFADINLLLLGNDSKGYDIMLETTSKK